MIDMPSARSTFSSTDGPLRTIRSPVRCGPQPTSAATVIPLVFGTRSSSTAQSLESTRDAAFTAASNSACVQPSLRASRPKLTISCWPSVWRAVTASASRPLSVITRSTSLRPTASSAV
jgi:hypothetical protein